MQSLCMQCMFVLWGFPPSLPFFGCKEYKNQGWAWYEFLAMKRYHPHHISNIPIHVIKTPCNGFRKCIGLLNSSLARSEPSLSHTGAPRAPFCAEQNSDDSMCCRFLPSQAALRPQLSATMLHSISLPQVNTCVRSRIAAPPSSATRKLRCVSARVASVDRPTTKNLNPNAEEKPQAPPPEAFDHKVDEPTHVAKSVKDGKVTKDLNVAAIGTLYTVKNHIPKRAAPAGYRTLDELPGVLFDVCVAFSACFCERASAHINPMLISYPLPFVVQCSTSVACIVDYTRIGSVACSLMNFRFYFRLYYRFHSRTLVIRTMP